jgi:hypothetical protein
LEEIQQTEERGQAMCPAGGIGCRICGHNGRGRSPLKRPLEQAG